MNTLFLERPEGRIAYDVEGTGPLVLCVPGMGDIRSTFRFVVPALLAAGYRVATVDLRGHGGSDATFGSYDDEAGASDVLALIEILGGPATIVGNSMGAAIAVLVAAERPELVTGLALLGPFLRDARVNPAMKVLWRILTARPWVVAAWNSYLPSLYAGTRPADFESYRAALIATMRRPGAASAFARTTRTSHTPAEAALPRVTAPALVLMGEKDPDFPSPAAEAEWIAEAIGARVSMVPDAGHYPQSQRADIVVPAIASFLASVAHA